MGFSTEQWWWSHWRCRALCMWPLLCRVARALPAHRPRLQVWPATLPTGQAGDSAVRLLGSWGDGWNDGRRESSDSPQRRTVLATASGNSAAAYDGRLVNGSGQRRRAFPPGGRAGVRLVYRVREPCARASRRAAPAPAIASSPCMRWTVRPHGVPLLAHE
jgi:hypothetical protein